MSTWSEHPNACPNCGSMGCDDCKWTGLRLCSFCGDPLNAEAKDGMHKRCLAMDRAERRREEQRNEA